MDPATLLGGSDLHGPNIGSADYPIRNDKSSSRLPSMGENQNLAWTRSLEEENRMTSISILEGFKNDGVR